MLKQKILEHRIKNPDLSLEELLDQTLMDSAGFFDGLKTQRDRERLMDEVFDNSNVWPQIEAKENRADLSHVYRLRHVMVWV